jgi:acyl dehydratase
MAQTGYSMKTLKDFVGKDVGVSGWHEVDQRRIDEFADCTGDRQWIHVDVERARRESPYGGTIAHGYLTLSLAAAMAIEAGVVPADAKAALNYGLDKVRFVAPVKAGARVRSRLVLMSVDAKAPDRVLIKFQSTIEIEGETRPALTAESLAMLLGGAG